MKGLDRVALEQVAEYFKSMAEPTRLQLLNALRGGEMTVSELAEQAGSTAANVSKHLSLLAKNGFVERRGQGTSVYYHITDPDIYSLCDLVCGQIAKRLSAQSNRQAAFRRAAKRV
ncbi:Transcriptional regulator [Georgfuchsia toluolica]|uniref:Transcriptional regulator n=1 Tax=Georgfuchsia toluolica TaxID=424218 RepID=A0A916NHA7_9PROT|nr:metalloregulator ArsR/SmtB family transcription factor [Georgfuchsia toluolica]CAG4883121.1 Transcriptional regulator [Georgfuchsia toluolica]